MAHILVIGGSSGIGAQVALQASRQGHRVRAMSRSGKRPRGAGESCEGFKGNALDGEDVRAGLAGVDAVVQALGIPASLKMVLEPVTLFSEATRVLLPLMAEAGVSRLISVTGFGAGDSRASISRLQRLPFELVFRNAYDDKSRQEQMIRDSDLDWLIVRPGTLIDGVHSKQYKVLTEPGEWRNGIVSRADVADFIVGELRPGGMSRQTPVIVRYRL